ncbi:AroM family protein [Candidatus Vecturithrix granuli]|uniref:AroM family protein n=1 Tax=Vecturithrix granuli TaxID=1499967 RepID=A0A081C0D2_VECG1|nr:AroM family protein [Candidatus Vecturithrix granuli]
MKPKIGTITIGQSPRVDVIPEIRPLIGCDVEILEMGALDGLSLEDVQSAYTPQAGDYILHTRMRDGTAVTIGKHAILPLMQACVDALTQQQVDLIVLLCTGHFPEFRSSVLLIEPQKITDNLIMALTGTQHKVGILIPLAEQVTQAKSHLSNATDNVIVVPASPYTSSNEITLAAEQLRQEQVELSVLHCIGYTLAMKQTVKNITGKPVILARSLVAQILRELLS